MIITFFESHEREEMRKSAPQVAVEDIEEAALPRKYLNRPSQKIDVEIVDKERLRIIAEGGCTEQFPDNKLRVSEALGAFLVELPMADLIVIASKLSQVLVAKHDDRLRHLCMKLGSGLVSFFCQLDKLC